MSHYVTDVKDTPKLYTIKKEFKIDIEFFKKDSSFEKINQTVEGMSNVGWKLRIAKQTHYEYIGLRLIAKPSQAYWEFYLEVTTDATIYYKVNLEISSENDLVSADYCGSFNDFKKIGIDILDSDLMSRFAHDIMLTVCVKALFSYKNKEDERIYGKTKMIQSNGWSQRLQNHGEKDFKFIVGNESIEIHKFFLSLESTVFATMFENQNFKETQTGEMVIKDFNVATVKAVVAFCYGEDISEFMKYTQNAIKLLMFADKYDMNNLKASFEEYYSKKLTKANVANVLTAGDNYNAPTLKTMCIDYIQSLPKAEKTDIAHGGLDEELCKSFI
uniref:BTB domain-containing protein n=1 Tax=Panagrolaimus sp. ES5 TaxID=591445 RepID=A0AC34F6Q2_9BILA